MSDNDRTFLPFVVQEAQMLYLTRKVGEAIVINDVIEITLIEIQGKNVKLGFQFPDTEKVLRRELHDKIKAETQAAARDVLVIQQALTDVGAKLNTDTLSDTTTHSANLFNDCTPKSHVK